MKNKNGIGLLGMLIAVVVVSLLLMAVLKQYTVQTQRVLNMPGAAELQRPAPTNGKPAAAGQTPAAAQCNGRLVGNICVPTEVRSASLDAFEQMNP